MSRPAPDSGVTAALVQVTRLAEQFGSLDTREGEHYRDVSNALTALGGSVDDLQAVVDDQGTVLESLDGIGVKLAGLAEAIKPLLPPNPGPGHNPAPAVEWWSAELSAKERDQAITRLRTWVDQIYRPLYGHLARQLADCWEQHPLALVTLDWLSELWAVLYLRPTRTAGILSSQAEFATRFLPAAAAQLAAETAGCEHSEGQSLTARGWDVR